MSGQEKESNFAKEFLARIYNDGTTLTSIPKQGRSEIWSKFRDPSSINPILANFPKIEPILHALETAKKNSKNLQSAILSECVYTFDIARLLGLVNYSEYSKFEGQIPNFAKAQMKKHGMLGRFVYFNEKRNEFLIQAGGPNSVDACYVSSTEEQLLWVEFKEAAAKYGEADLLYDDDGFVVQPPKFASKHPNFIRMLDSARDKKLNIFEYSKLQKNYNQFEDELVSDAIVSYFTDAKNTVVFTEDEESNLMGMLPGDVPRLASRIEGEIRSAGRNPKKLFTKSHFYEVFEEMGGIRAGASKCRVEISKIKEHRKAKGDAGKVTGIKISSLYFVRFTHISEENGEYFFDLKNVFQLKSSIASKAFFEHVRVESAKHLYLV
jgi:hypothetical protein